jgi:hypothetical protein
MEYAAVYSGRGVPTFRRNLLSILRVNDGAAGSPNTFVLIYRTPRRHIEEDRNFFVVPLKRERKPHIHRRQDVKLHIFMS